MRRLFTLLVLLLIFNSANAQTGVPTCFNDLRFDKIFFAIDTHKESELVGWYQKVFGMKVLKKFESEDKKVTGIILQKNDLYIEILHNNGSGSEFSGKTGNGLKKVGLFVDHPVEDLKDCLRRKDLQVGRIFHDREMGVKLLHLTDPEGNELEIISADTL
ncbi:VOC family protein [Salinimicrobium catena]|uniref:VOC family protein n=1 Tax=Salinimicrobium catena TaxID=390640 RepID=UPI002FE46E58